MFFNINIYLIFTKWQQNAIAFEKKRQKTIITSLTSVHCVHMKDLHRKSSLHFFSSHSPIFIVHYLFSIRFANYFLKTFFVQLA